jgi:hypothetical protein
MECTTNSVSFQGRSAVSHVNSAPNGTFHLQSIRSHRLSLLSRHSKLCSQLSSSTRCCTRYQSRSQVVWLRVLTTEVTRVILEVGPRGILRMAGTHARSWRCVVWAVVLPTLISYVDFTHSFFLLLTWLVNRIDWNHAFFQTYYETRSYGHFLVNFNRIRVNISHCLVLHSLQYPDHISGEASHSSALTWPATALGVRLQPVIMIRSYILKYAALLAPYKLHRDHLPAVFRLTRQTRVRATGLAPRLILSKHLTPMRKWSKGVDFIRLGEHCRCIGDRIEPTIPSFLNPRLIPASRESVTSLVISSEIITLLTPCTTIALRCRRLGYSSRAAAHQRAPWSLAKSHHTPYYHRTPHADIVQRHRRLAPSPLRRLPMRTSCCRHHHHTSIVIIVMRKGKRLPCQNPS